MLTAGVAPAGHSRQPAGHPAKPGYYAERHR
jgi:hypothetical protein